MWIRVAKDNLKACVPFKQSIRRFHRKAFPYRSQPANDDWAFAQGLDLIRLAGAHGIGLDTVLEVGSGWVPTIPHMLKACGAGRVVLTDVERLADPATFRFARDFVARSLDRIAKVTGAAPEVLRANLARPDDFDYRCPPRTQDLPGDSVDLIYSRTVLEHIPEPVLVELTAEWARLLKPGGHCVHIIDNSDHFEHRDKRLSRLNFLTVPDWAWRLACLNRQNYQNRMRHSEYVALFEASSLDLVHAAGDVDRKALADLAGLPLQPRFAGRDKADLAVLTSIIVARKPVAVEPARPREPPESAASGAALRPNSSDTA